MHLEIQMPDRDKKIHINNHTDDGNKPLRSGSVQEIISRQPGFLERWALVIFLLVLSLLIAGTWFIRYPDIIETRAILNSDNAPKEIIPLREGRLIKLFARNDEQVKVNTCIGWIESTASHDEVIRLSNQLDSITACLATGQIQRIASFSNCNYMRLGDLQTGYQHYMAAYQQFSDYLLNGFYDRKEKLLKQDINSLGQMNSAIEKQKQIAKQDIDLAGESFKMNDRLLNEKVISKEEYRIQKSKYLNKQNSLPQLNNSQLSNLSEQRDKQKELSQLQHDIIQQKLIFEQETKTVKSAVDDWMRQYMLISPTSGKLVFITPMQENKFLLQGKLIGYIVPDDSRYYAEMILPQDNSGKVDTGQQVQLRIEAYPYEEFGSIDGKVSYISRVPSDSGFLAIVSFDKGLMTTYHKRLQFKNGLTAQAVIITHEMRLLQRIYYSIVKGVSPGK